MSKYHYGVIKFKDQKSMVSSTQPTVATEPKKDSQYGIGTQSTQPGEGSGSPLKCSGRCNCNCAGAGCGCACAGSATTKKVSFLRKKI